MKHITATELAKKLKLHAAFGNYLVTPEDPEGNTKEDLREMIWRTNDKKGIKVKDLGDDHLVNIIKFLKRRGDPAKSSDKYTRKIFNALLHERKNRKL